MHTEYLTYSEYQKFGGALPQSTFTPLEFKCRKRIDYLTDSRVQNMAAVPGAVKLCMMSLISMENAGGAETQVNKPVVTSYNTDGYSESYGHVMGAADVAKSMNATIRNFLYGELDDNGVPLLFRGVNG